VHVDRDERVDVDLGSGSSHVNQVATPPEHASNPAPSHQDECGPPFDGIEQPDVQPAPVTTIAWSLHHIAVDCLDSDVLGPHWGAFAEHSPVDLVLHALHEVTHHAAEIALRRDLYATRRPG
jgi:hypothetical protein